MGRQGLVAHASVVQSEERLASASEHWRDRPTPSTCPLTRRSTRDEEIRGDTGGH